MSKRSERSETEMVDRWFPNYGTFGLKFSEAVSIARNCEITQRREPNRAWADILVAEVDAYETAIGVDSRLSMGGT